MHSISWLNVINIRCIGTSNHLFYTSKSNRFAINETIIEQWPGKLKLYNFNYYVRIHKNNDDNGDSYNSDMQDHTRVVQVFSVSTICNRNLDQKVFYVSELSN